MIKPLSKNAKRSTIETAKERVTQRKAPPRRISMTDPRPHVGVEIEFFSRRSREAIINEIAFAGLSKWVFIGNDSSVGCNDCGGGGCSHGHEANVLVREGDYEPIERFCEVLKSLRVGVNRTCGLHVHLDQRFVSQDKAEKRFKNLVKMQDFLYALCSPSRERSQYCRKTSTSNGLGEKSQGTRYLGVNPEAYDEHETIEIRIHQGTTNAAKIVNWIKTLLLIQGASFEKAPKSLATIAERFGLDDGLKKYARERIAKFSEEKEIRVGKRPFIDVKGDPSWRGEERRERTKRLADLKALLESMNEDLSYWSKKKCPCKDCANNCKNIQAHVNSATAEIARLTKDLSRDPPSKKKVKSETARRREIDRELLVAA